MNTLFGIPLDLLVLALSVTCFLLGALLLFVLTEGGQR